MCGIVGGIAFTDKGLERLPRIGKAITQLRKRGPDGDDFFVSGHVALGHTRLSIIDVSTCASQPMWDETGRFAIVFNGEIFNYRELAQKYFTDEERARFRSTSDTEVLLSLFLQKGAGCLPLLDGFFAFAIFDKESGEVFIARDRFGKKPIHLYRDGDNLLFASELKALFDFGIPKEINLESLYQYLQLNYIPQPQGILRSVTKLPGGHYLTVRNGVIEQQRYYAPALRPDDYGKLDYESAKKELVRLMDGSVRERLVSDVPLGAFLSGGIDSSVVVAMASRHVKGLRTFSIGYKDNPFFDETHYANLVAKKYGTDHTVFSLTTNDFLAHVYDVLDYIDEPFADSSAIPQFILSYYTRKHVTVALSGDGGDEVFAGYNKHAAEYKIRRKSLANAVVSAGYPIWKMLPKGRNSRITNLFRQLQRFAEGSRMDTKSRYWRWASINDANKAGSLLQPALRQRLSRDRFVAERNDLLQALDGDDFNSLLLTDLRLVLAGDMLVKVDLMSMANSLEVRSPFLDHKVVDFAFGLPSSYKIDGKMKKKIVQDAFREYLPEELYNRPKKGFEIPMLGWLRHELSPLADELFEPGLLREQGIFDVEAIQALRKKLHTSNPEDSHATLWALIVFQYWWKKYYRD